MSDYYKSLITDEEVINELMKDSKKREGRLPTEVTRLRPNLNFFERTVNNLVSNNTRIEKSQGTLKSDYPKDCNIEKADSVTDSFVDKQKIDYAFEREVIMQRKINFVGSAESFSSTFIGNKKKIEIKKINFIGTGANTSNQGHRSSNNSLENSNEVSSNQRICDISNDSHNDVIIMSSDDDERKTTCKIITNKSKESKSKDSIKNNIICISSDDESVKVIGRKSAKKKKKIKKDKMRKKNKSPRESEEEYKKKAKRKRH